MHITSFLKKLIISPIKLFLKTNQLKWGNNKLRDHTKIEKDSNSKNVQQIKKLMKFRGSQKGKNGFFILCMRERERERNKNRSNLRKQNGNDQKLHAC